VKLEGCAREIKPAGVFVKSNRLTKLVLSAPIIIFALLLVAYPLFQGLQTGFFNFTLQNPAATFAGFDNFVQLFRKPGFVNASIFTVIFALVCTTLETVLGFALAILMNRVFPGKRILFTLILVPIMIAPALLGIMFRLLLNADIGLLPSLLKSVGLDVSLFDPHSIFPLLVVLDIAQWTPFTFLVIYAGLQSMPTDVLEASAIDGAGRWRTLTSIVIPLIKPVIFAAAFLRLIDAIRTFDVIYVLTGGGPGTSTTTISIYIYKVAFESGNFGLAAAAATVVMIVLLPLVPVLVKRISRPEEHTS